MKLGNCNCVHQLFEEQVFRTPEAIAAVFGNQRITYGELNQKANQLAHNLISIGVGPDKIVGLITDRSFEMIIGILGILKSGGAYLPISPDLPDERIQYMISNSNTELLLTQNKYFNKVYPGTKKINLEDQTSCFNSDKNPPIINKPTDLVYVIYTSGSTGKPKGVMIEHQALINRLVWMQKEFPIGNGDFILQKTPYSFDVSVWELFWWAIYGAGVVFLEPGGEKNPSLIVDTIEKNKITVMHFVPSMLNLFLDSLASKEQAEVNKLKSLKYIFASGEALKPSQVKKFNELVIPHTDATLINLYGPTEAAIDVSCFICPKHNNFDKIPIGKPIDNINLLIVKDNKLITDGETGELCIAGIGLARGYLNNSELTNEKFVTNISDPSTRMYKTGDLARVLPDGNIEFLGREDFQVKIRGFRIELGEIENAIRKVKDVNDCVVTVQSYSDEVTRILAYIVSENEIDNVELKKILGEFLPEYMVPNSFIQIDEIPLTSNGKTDLKSLASLKQKTKTESSTLSDTEIDKIEKDLISVWKNLLGVDEIDVNDNFFDLGGNSLLMGRLQIILGSEFKIKVSMVDLFQYPTISSLTNYFSKKNELIKNENEGVSINRNNNGKDIAVIGIAGRYPGANNINEFWKNLVDGVESISFFTEEELEYLPKGNLKSELVFVKARGVIEDVDKFDANFFGYTPREAELMDPQHRVFLECAWEALEDAGYSPDKYKGNIGVFAGSSLNAYLMFNVLKDRESQEELLNAYQIGEYKTITANDNSFLTTKVAYKLGLRGPAINIQTACSTSLVAIGQAYQSLLSGESDMALAGGVSITFPQKRGYFFVDGSIGSVDGHCKAFDADATGTVFASGAGLVVLKRLEDAIKDGDSIYAVIKSVALNNDGSGKAGYMTPSVEGQSEVIKKAHEMAGVQADSIKYVETHGTGTPVGDPIEVASLEKAFRLTSNAKQFCGIGSVKSNIGHTDAAAGVTGLIKTALSLHHKVIPPSLHYKNPNPGIDFANSPFYVVDKLTSLEGMEHPLRAAVSAFGVGGTNAHAILEEFPTHLVEENVDEKQILILSAKNETSLQNNLKALKDYLKNNPEKSLGDIAYTLQQGRKEFDWKQFVVVGNGSQAHKEIEAIITTGMNKAKSSSNEKPHLVFMFPGQGAQYVNMGKDLYTSEKIFADVVDKCAEVLKPYLELDIRNLLFPENNNEETAKKLEQTVYTQPALFIIEYALAQLLISRGIKPASMIGHSVGEYVAACIAGVFSLEDALFILSMRAKLMQQQAPGSMLSVRLNETEIQEYLSDDISLAAINSPTLLVLSGETEKIKALSEKLSSKNIENRFLFTSHAYHSKMMEPALKPFVTEFTKIKLNKPSSPFISSVTGTWITDEQAVDANYWASQLRNAVRFSSGIFELQKKNNLILIELGPGRALSTMASQHRNDSVKQTIVTTLVQPNEDADDSKNLLSAIGKLWISGFKIDWNNFHLNKKRRRVHLPTYQFDKLSYWIEAPKNGRSKNPLNINAQIPNRVKQIINKPKTKKIVRESTMTRKEYIVDILKSILEELSGIKKESLVESKTFLELGFDSLFMTQVSLAFQKKLEVKITLRQLIDTAPTILAIAEFIDGKLPAGKFEPPKQEIILEEESEEVLAAYDESSSNDISQHFAQSNNGNSAVERLLFEQLEIMKKQLDVIGGKGIKNVPVINQEAKPQKVETVTANVDLPSSPKKDEKKVFERFGPYKPIETKKGEGLNVQQQKYLDKLIADYNKKTANSKKLTQEHRAHYSDPRTVSGFLPIWKEMTYQVITKKSDGSKLWDVDDNEYIDVIMGFGQYLFGHNPKFIRDAIEEQLKLGFEIGPQSPIAGEVARLICEFTGMDRAAFCVTGSEAVLGAVRAARTVTGKDKIVFFTGDYHGIIDEVLVKTTVNGDQIRTMPIAPGIPKENVQNSITLEYGTEESLRIIEKLLPEIAAVMVEPVQARRPDLQPKEFLQKLRKMTEDANVALIFDEVITGFRSTPGGAQEWFDVKADLGTFGKVIGGGFPIGVIAGKKLYMDAFDGGGWQYGDDSIPEAGVTFFAGTFARHPLSLTACYAVLKYLKSKNGSIQKKLNQKAGQLSEELNSFMQQRNVPIKIMNFSSVIYYSYPKDLNYFSLLFYVLRHMGIHILEGFPFFLSEAHSEADIKFIIKAFKESIIELQDNGFFPAPLVDKNQSVACMCNVPIDKNKFPLTEAQKEIWIASLMSDKASCAFNESAHLMLKGRLNIPSLEKAFQKIIDRHESLRTTFTKDGKLQVVHSKSEFKLILSDLSSLSENEKQNTLDRKLNSETTKLFDLFTGPLLRAELVKLNSEFHYLIITAHHIICDGWSYDVMVSDLSRIYSEEVEQKFSMPEPPMQMREFVSYMSEIKHTKEYKDQEDYWLEKFKSPFNETDLPVDYNRPEVRTFNGSRVTGKIEKDLFSKVKTLSYKTSNTLFVTLLSAFSVMLNKLTQSEDIITGIPAAGQQVVGKDDLVGHCTNLLPIRANVKPDLKFSEYLKQIKMLVLDAYDNQQVTYGDLISKLKIKRSAGRTPLLSTMFNIDPAIMGLKFSELESTLTANPRSGFQFELGFNLVNADDVCEIECDYNSDLFSQATIQKFINYYNFILEQIVEDADKLLSDIQILSSSEIEDLMNFMNNGETNDSI